MVYFLPVLSLVSLMVPPLSPLFMSSEFPGSMVADGVLEVVDTLEETLQSKEDSKPNLMAALREAEKSPSTAPESQKTVQPHKSRAPTLAETLKEVCLRQFHVHERVSHGAPRSLSRILTPHTPLT